MEQDFPDWHFWRSDLGRWWATRRGGLTAEQLELGCATTVNADGAAKLAQLLRAEENLLAEMRS